MKNKSEITALNADDIEQVSGGLAPLAVAALFLGAGGGGVTFGYTVGKDWAMRDNRADQK